MDDSEPSMGQASSFEGPASSMGPRSAQRLTGLRAGQEHGDGRGVSVFSAGAARQKRRFVPRKRSPESPRRFTLANSLFWSIAALTACTFIVGVVYQSSTTSLLARPRRDDRSFDGGDAFGQRLLRPARDLLDVKPGSETVAALSYTNLRHIRKRLREELSSRLQFRQSNQLQTPTRPATIVMALRDLRRSPDNVYALTVGVALHEMGYKVQVMSFFGGCLAQTWRQYTDKLTIFNSTSEALHSIDWLRFDAIIANGPDTASFVSRLSVEPFTSVPLMWIHHDNRLARLLANHTAAAAAADERAKEAKRRAQLLELNISSPGPSAAAASPATATGSTGSLGANSTGAGSAGSIVSSEINEGGAESGVAEGTGPNVGQGMNATAAAPDAAAERALAKAKAEAEVLQERAEADTAWERVRHWHSLVKRADALVVSDAQLKAQFMPFMNGAAPVILPGTPAHTWDASVFAIAHSRNSARASLGVANDTIVVTSIGSSLPYAGAWREHALVLRAVQRVHTESRGGWWMPSKLGTAPKTHIVCIVGADALGTAEAMQALSRSLGNANITVQVVEADGAGAEAEPGHHAGLNALLASDIAINAGAVAPADPDSQEALPAYLLQAMALHKLVLAPRFEGIAPVIRHRVQGILFSAGNEESVAAALRLALYASLKFKQRLANGAYAFALRSGARSSVLGISHALKALLKMSDADHAGSGPTRAVFWRQGWLWAAEGTPGDGKSGASSLSTVAEAPESEAMESDEMDSYGFSSGFASGPPVASGFGHAVKETFQFFRALLRMEDGVHLKGPGGVVTDVAAFLLSSPSPTLADVSFLQASSHSQKEEDRKAEGTIKQTIKGSGFLEDLEDTWHTEAENGFMPPGQAAKLAIHLEDLEQPLDDLSFLQRDPTGPEEEEEQRLARQQEAEAVEKDHLADRRDKFLGTFDDIRVQVKKSEKEQAVLHFDRDDGELERTGQPVLLYEPYYGNGSWPFLHSWNTLYRGLCMLPGAKRVGPFDDINGWQRLPVLSTPYYRDAMCEMGAMLSVGYHMNHIHRQPWIGFQSWRATAQGLALSRRAASALTHALDAYSGVTDPVIFWVTTGKGAIPHDVPHSARPDSLAAGESRAANAKSTPLSSQSTGAQMLATSRRLLIGEVPLDTASAQLRQDTYSTEDAAIGADSTVRSAASSGSSSGSGAGTPLGKLAEVGVAARAAGDGAAGGSVSSSGVAGIAKDAITIDESYVEQYLPSPPGVEGLFTGRELAEQLGSDLGDILGATAGDGWRGGREEDFWADCDAVNRGNCRSAFLSAFKVMYGLPTNWTALPPMPKGSGTWSSMHSWAMPSASFKDFVMFARMFIDALDVTFFHDHYTQGICPLANSPTEARHCYCRVLDRLVNVWAYHSGRRLLYMNPETGVITEQHPVENRRGKGRRMWTWWFAKDVMESMDADRAEEWDDSVGATNGTTRWLWPHTGVVSWKGSQEREKAMRAQHKIDKERLKNERLAKMRLGYKQKSLDKLRSKKKRKSKKVDFMRRAP